MTASPVSPDPPLPPEETGEDALRHTISDVPIVGYNGIPSQALVVADAAWVPPPPSESSSAPSDDEDDMDDASACTGPLDASRCTLSGPGLSGGCAGAPVKLVITAHDSGGRRVREGGAYVLVTVAHPSLNTGVGVSAIAADVVDRGDGSYVATYAVPVKGLYQVHVCILGESHPDSPLSVYFSDPEPGSSWASLGGAGGLSTLAPPAGGPSSVAPNRFMAAADLAQAAQAMAVLSAPGGASLALGAQAAGLGAAFPPPGWESSSVLESSVLLGGVSPYAGPEAISTLLASCGRALAVLKLAGPFAAVRFERPSEAQAALALQGFAFLGQPLRVESGPAAAQQVREALARGAAPRSAALGSLPQQALHAQHAQQAALLQAQHSALLEQVAAMRAAARSGSATARAATAAAAAAAAAAVGTGALPALPPGAGALAVAALGAREEGGGRRRSRSRSAEGRGSGRSRRDREEWSRNGVAGNKDRDRYAGKNRDHHYGRGRDRYSSRDRDRYSSRDADRYSTSDKYRYSSRDKGRYSSRDEDRYSGRDEDRYSSRDKDRHSSRDKGRHSSRDKDRHSSKERYSDKGRHSGKERSSGRDLDRASSRNGDGCLLQDSRGNSDVVHKNGASPCRRSPAADELDELFAELER